MHTLEQEPRQKSFESQKRSFDLLSSVYSVRHDLQKFGYVHAETEQRIYDEELTLIAEGIDLFSYTKFTLQEQEGDLVFFDKGEWRPYIGTLITGLNVAKAEAKYDYRREFLVDWATRDLEVGYKLESLRPGEVLSWDSPFPHKQRELYGDEFLASVGLQPKRQMGFEYRAERNEDGSLTLETHSIDMSDTDAFAASRELTRDNPRASIRERIATHDEVLSRTHGEEFLAGRRLSEKASQENAWDFLEKNKSLVTYYMAEIRKLAESSIEGEDLHKSKKILTIGVWARTKQLLQEQTTGVTGYLKQSTVYIPQTHEMINRQVHSALHHAVIRQESMIGCGGGVSAKGLLDMNISEAFNAIYGEGIDKEETSKVGEMRCVNCPECSTFHEKVRKVKGKLVCDNKECKLAG